jgi:hypothetical protein
LDATVNEALRQFVCQRAGERCDYCRLPRAVCSIPFDIDHIIARQHGGKTVAGNLAFACFYCNSSKGPNLSGIDNLTRKLVRLYHPRRHQWSYHFRWDGPRLVGKTPIGRATVVVLGINGPLEVALRESLIREGLFP